MVVDVVVADKFFQTFFKTFLCILIQSAGAVEYRDCISAER